MAKQFHGVTQDQEFQTTGAVRDVRPIYKQVGSFLAGRTGALIVLFVFAMIVFLAPALFEVFVLFSIILFWFTIFQTKTLPFKLPVFCDYPDKNDPKPGGNIPGEAAGIYYFGNDIISSEQLWFTNSDMRTHALIFGSTGSGKTEALLSLSFNALIHGSGFIYVDGKGDNSLFAKVFSMVRGVGREDDLVIINFMTGAADIIGPQATVLSNTLNPFAAGSSSMLSNLVVSLMDSGGGGNNDGDMWKGRAIAFMEALMRPLVWMRDKGYMLMDAGVIRRYFTLDVLEELLYDKKYIDHNNNSVSMDQHLPFDVRDPLENYLSTLPGYQKSAKGKQSGKAYEQHGYITMQLTKIFGSLADTYGHIIKTNLAEVDLNDVVLNRRILVVLLPAMEKSPDELANLGKLIIASLKSMLAAGLGSSVEGDIRDVIESKPTNSRSPYLCILDEYGYYAVKGFAVVPAQARSLGFSVIFAGQDLPAFQKASKEEAASICANTNIKICMKLEDPVETWDFFNKTAGEAYVTVTRSFNRSGVGAMRYIDGNEATLDKRARISLLDLKDQREGEAHIFFKSKIVRSTFFYANPPATAAIKVNQFVKVQKPPGDRIRTLREIYSKKTSLKKLKIPQDAMIDEIVSLYKESFMRKTMDQQTKKVVAFISGHKDEEVVDFGDMADNYSIFMALSVDERLSSDFFDVEISNLQESILTKDKLYDIVKKIAIIEGKSEGFAKDMSNEVINVVETQTNYGDCMPRSDRAINKLMSAFLEKHPEV